MNVLWLLRTSAAPLQAGRAPEQQLLSLMLLPLRVAQRTSCCLQTLTRILVLQELRKQTSKCPICRDQVDSLLHIKMQKTQHKTPTGAAAAAAAQKIEELKV